MTQEEYDSLKQLKPESELTALIIGKIQALLPGRFVVSSESYPWLSTYPTDRILDLKADIFITNPAFCSIRSSRGGVPCGVPAHASLYMGVDLIDVKLSYTDRKRAFGETIQHAEYLGRNTQLRNQSEHIFCHAVAFRKAIWLFHYQKEVVIDLEVVQWNLAGSAQRLADFFCERDPISRVLNEALSMLDMQICRDNLGFPQAFLGAGAAGFVFKVLPRNGSSAPMALKIVVDKEHVPSVPREYLLNRALPEDCVVRACEFLMCPKSKGAAILFREVGARPSDIDDIAVQNKALAALAKLHSAGFAHGDARLDNLLDFGAAYKWCDVERAVKVDDRSRQFLLVKDVSTLFKSLGSKAKDMEIKLHDYIADPSAHLLLSVLKDLPCRSISSMS
jgi:hypothetical protein